MAKLREATLVLGEGITEFYYLNSLKNSFPTLQIEPTIPKHSSLKELAKKIDKAIDDGYSNVFCIIDMDNKREGSEKAKYNIFKRRYDKKTFKGCKIRLFETEPCTELFFLFYFKFTTKEYTSSTELINDLQAVCDYDKNGTFFCKNPLHRHFERENGSLTTAINNAKQSCKSKEERNYTYSELGEMFDALNLTV